MSMYRMMQEMLIDACFQGTIYHMIAFSDMTKVEIKYNAGISLIALKLSMLFFSIVICILWYFKQRKESQHKEKKKEYMKLKMAKR